MDVKAVMTAMGKSINSVGPNAPLTEAIRLLTEKNVGAILVLDEGQHVVGVISERDVVRLIDKKGEQALKGTVADAMTCDVVACTSDSSLDSVISGMAQFQVRHLPVMEDGRLLGLISIKDALRYRIAQLEQGEEPRFQRWFPQGRVYSLSDQGPG